MSLTSRLNIDELPCWLRRRPTSKAPDWAYGRFTRHDPALKGAPAVGISTAFDLPFVVIDIDHTTERPACWPQTYEEISQSGNGLHLIYLLAEEKQQKLGKVLIAPASADIGWEMKYGDNAFTIITGNTTENSLPQHYYTVISHKDFLPLLLPEKEEPKLPKTPSVTLAELKQLVRVLPISQPPSLRTAWEKVTKTKYHHYTYWCMVGMAIHYESSKLGVPDEGAALFLDWSKRDPASYISAEDVLTHYKSFSVDTANPITSATLKALIDANLLKFKYFNSKGQIDSNHPKNIDALYNHYNLAYYDGGYITADESILYYFEHIACNSRFGYIGPLTVGQITHALDIIAHDHGWRGKGMEKKLFGVLDELKKPSPDWLNLWWHTPANKLPDELANSDNVNNPKAVAYSTFATVANAFTINEDRELGLLQLKKHFFQVIKMHHPRWKADENEGFLCLTGKQASHKTSFFNLWIPNYFKFLYKIDSPELSDEKGDRDFKRTLEAYALINYDECDSILNSNNKSAARLKAYITGQEVAGTKIYETEDTVFRRQAVLVGTTNERRLRLPDTGTRRFWIIDVDNIETWEIDPRHSPFSWYHFYRSLWNEFETLTSTGQRPWLLSADEVMRVTKYNKRFTCMSSAEEEILQLLEFEKVIPILKEDILKAIGNIDGSGLDTQVVRPGVIRGFIRANMGYNPKLPELKRALEAVACSYLGGIRGMLEIEGKYKNTFTWEDGMILTNGVPRGYLLPPLKQIFRSQYGRRTHSY